MSAFEFFGNIGSDGKITVPQEVKNSIRGVEKNVRVVLFWPTDPDAAAWQGASLDAFRKQDGPADAVYDTI